jgi:hypothetical protein
VRVESWPVVTPRASSNAITCIQAALPDMLAADGAHRHHVSSQRSQHGPLWAASSGSPRRWPRAGPQRRHRQNHPAQPGRHPHGSSGRGPRRLPGRQSGRPYAPHGPSRHPADSAAACSYLCSESGSYVTGKVIGVNSERDVCVGFLDPVGTLRPPIRGGRALSVVCTR